MSPSLTEGSPAVKELEIPAKLSDLEYSVNELQEVIQALHARLNPVLHTLTPEKEAEPSKTSSTEIGGILDKHISRIKDSKNFINQLIRALEI